MLMPLALSLILNFGGALPTEAVSPVAVHLPVAKDYLIEVKKKKGRIYYKQYQTYPYQKYYNQPYTYQRKYYYRQPYSYRYRYPYSYGYSYPYTYTYPYGTPYNYRYNRHEYHRSYDPLSAIIY